METTAHAPAAPATAETGKAAPAQPSAKAAAPAPSKAAAPAAAKPKLGADPNRQLNKRYTYAGVVDTGPVAGETFEQKVARLKVVAAAAKQRAEEGGGEVAPAVAADSPVVETVLESAMTPPESETSSPGAATSSPSPTQKPTGQADRTLMIRSTYCGVVDTGPVPGETFEQKVARLAKVSAAAKQRAEGG